jgi:hypothetical protein|tara:strand:+ start:148 stop:1446 length:1299 start_codon:yes stop_codon:yes gene_type:complete
MLSFTGYIQEKRQSKEISSLKSYVKSKVEEVGIKLTGSGRGGYHIRFPLPGEMKDFQSFFNLRDLKVSDIDKIISSKFDTYILTTTKKINQIPKGTSIHWVNNAIGRGSTGGLLFNNKDLTPDTLGLAGQILNKKELISKVSTVLKSKYDSNVADSLIQLMNLAQSKSDRIDIKGVHNFTTKDLAKVSSDFGEILSAIWSMSPNMNFKQTNFPLASNEKLIDFYGIRMGIEYPISVKSGIGGKVTIQNITDAIKRRAKTTKNDNSAEESLQIFNIVSDNTMKRGMIKLHQYLNTPDIEKLGKIVGVMPITLEYLETWVKDKSNEELIELLDPFWKFLGTKLTDKKKYDEENKLRLILSPLGQSIEKILNSNKSIRDSLTNVARQVTLIQVNVDVKSNQMIFKKNKFKDIEFEFAWPGYTAGNKMGFLAKFKK